MQPDAPGEEDSAEWLRRARSSLSHAKHQAPDVDFEDLCFDAQQAAEKAVLIKRGVRFPYVHDLADLLTVAERSGEAVPEEIREAAALTRFAVATRYPGAAEPVSLDEYEYAVEVAERVVRWAEGRIA